MTTFRALIYPTPWESGSESKQCTSQVNRKVSVQTRWKWNLEFFKPIAAVQQAGTSYERRKMQRCHTQKSSTHSQTLITNHRSSPNHRKKPPDTCLIHSQHSITIKSSPHSQASKKDPIKPTAYPATYNPPTHPSIQPPPRPSHSEKKGKKTKNATIPPTTTTIPPLPRIPPFPIPILLQPRSSSSSQKRCPETSATPPLSPLQDPHNRFTHTQRWKYQKNKAIIGSVFQQDGIKVSISGQDIRNCHKGKDTLIREPPPSRPYPRIFFRIRTLSTPSIIHRQLATLAISLNTNTNTNPFIWTQALMKAPWLLRAWVSEPLGWDDWPEEEKCFKAG